MRAIVFTVVAACASLAGCAAAAPTVARAPGPPPTPPPRPLASGAVPTEGDFVVKNFRFASGATLAELKIHYATFGTPMKDAAGHTLNAVLILHGTTGSGRQFLAPQFADVLFGPGQPLDVTKYFIILPDDIGHGQSSKPSDGLHARFPEYRYADMVALEHELVTRGLGVDRLRLLMGTSMGCMHSFLWAERWPEAMDAVMPLACLPVAIAGRNRLWRKLVVDGIREDPAWKGGDYTEQPRAALRIAGDLLAVVGAAPLEMQKRLSTPEAVDKYVAETGPKWDAAHDANDILYAVSSSRDYDPSAELGKIVAPLVLVNSSDDFINPPELGIAEKDIQKVKRGRFVLLPASPETHGHGTHTWAAFWKDILLDLIAKTEK